MENKGRVFFSLYVKPKPLSGVSGVLVNFQEVSLLPKYLTSHLLPFYYLCVPEPKFLLRSFLGEEVLLCAIPNVIHAPDSFAIEVEALCIGKPFLE